MVDRSDLTAIRARYEQERRGSPPHHPRLKVKVLLYGYCMGVTSFRRLAQHLQEDNCFRVLAAQPDARLPHALPLLQAESAPALGDLFVQVLELWSTDRAGAVGACGPRQHQSEGQRLQASCDKLRGACSRNAPSCGMRRMCSCGRSRRWMPRKTVNAAVLGAGDEWPAELAFRGDRDTPAGGPPNKAQRNFTDPESRFMPNAGGKDIGLAYNCLAFVDSAQQVIVADRAAAQSGDKQQALPKIRETTQMCPGRSPRMRAATTPRCRRPTCLFPRERMRWKLRTR